ncbi:histidine kinase [Sphingobacterium spiritivorum]|uniref:histidine kinase n=1 Tax=Sphingobacterium spiritivorum TaxID=258 RepID=UPI003DA212D2
MSDSENKNIVSDLLTEPQYSVLRCLFVFVAILATTLSQSFFVFGKSAEISTGTIYFFGAALALSTFIIIYFNVHYLAPYYLSKREYASYLLILFLLVSILVFGKGIGEFYLFATAGIQKHGNMITILDGLSNMVLYSICVASTSIGIIFRQLLEDKTKIENLESKQLRNSINKIKNSIQPAFLYATLDYTSKIVKSKPVQASDTLYKLSDLLRYQLYDSTRHRVLLTSEIAFIRNYLLIHQQNTEGNFSFEVIMNGNCNKLIAPSVFTPCIEELIGLNATNICADFSIQGEEVELKLMASGIDEESDFNEAFKKLKSVYENSILIKKAANSLNIQIRV